MATEKDIIKSKDMESIYNTWKEKYFVSVSWQSRGKTEGMSVRLKNHLLHMKISGVSKECQIFNLPKE